MPRGKPCCGAKRNSVFHRRLTRFRILPARDAAWTPRGIWRARSWPCCKKNLAQHAQSGEADVFFAHQMFIDDIALLKNTRAAIAGGLNAEAAWMEPDPSLCACPTRGAAQPHPQCACCRYPRRRAACSCATCLAAHRAVCSLSTPL